MKEAIIGAGKMGVWFAKFFLGEGHSVIISDTDKPKLLKIQDELDVEIADTIAAVKDVDRVIICVPIANFEDVVKELSSYIQPHHMVMDICSIKEIPVQIMHKYIQTGKILGTHPVFGPGTKKIENQNFVLTPSNIKERRIAENLKIWLEKKQTNVFIMPPKKHDELMSLVLGLPHFFGMVVGDFLLNYPAFLSARKVAGPSFKLLLTWVEAIASEEAYFYTNLQMYLPQISHIENLFLEKTNEWVNTIKKKDEKALTNKIELVQSMISKVNPNYKKSYKAMHECLEIIEN